MLPEEKEEDKNDDDKVPDRTTLTRRLRRAVEGQMGERRFNPIVYLDIGLEDEFLGRLTIELRADLVMMTCENFRLLCTGERGQHDGVRLHYKNTKFHRIVRNSHIQGGDLRDGTGETSIGALGGIFPDENFILRHTGPGVLSMGNKGVDSNGSAFFITFAANPKLDDKHVVFGALANDDSLAVLYAIERLGSDSGRPSRGVPVIKDCGQLYPPR